MSKVQQQDVLGTIVKARLWNDDVGGLQVHLHVQNLLCFDHIHQTYKFNRTNLANVTKDVQVLDHCNFVSSVSSCVCPVLSTHGTVRNVISIALYV